jgi:hypothetical protein
VRVRAPQPGHKAHFAENCGGVGAYEGARGSENLMSKLVGQTRHLNISNERVGKARMLEKADHDG